MGLDHPKKFYVSQKELRDQFKEKVQEKVDALMGNKY
jgi:hypothetical protein